MSESTRFRFAGFLLAHITRSDTFLYHNLASVQGLRGRIGIVDSEQG